MEDLTKTCYQLHLGTKSQYITASTTSVKIINKNSFLQVSQLHVSEIQNCWRTLTKEGLCRQCFYVCMKHSKLFLAVQQPLTSVTCTVFSIEKIKAADQLLSLKLTQHLKCYSNYIGVCMCPPYSPNLSFFSYSTFCSFLPYTLHALFSPVNLPFCTISEINIQGIIFITLPPFLSQDFCGLKSFCLIYLFCKVHVFDDVQIC